jgi:hypothetical protein
MVSLMESTANLSTVLPVTAAHHPFERPTVYTMVLHGPGDAPAERLRYAIADEAVADPAWRETYNQMADAGKAAPEQQRCHKVRTTPGQALAGCGDSPTQRAGALWARVIECGGHVLLPEPEDLLVAVVAAEVWFAALGATQLNTAVSYGWDAVNSLAAILARSIGEPTEPTGYTPPQDGQSRISVEAVEQTVTAMRDWVWRSAHPQSWERVRDLAASDLRWNACGYSRTSEAAALLATS